MKIMSNSPTRAVVLPQLSERNLHQLGSWVAWVSRQRFARHRPEHTVCRPRSRRSLHTGQREPTRDGGPRTGAFGPIHPVSTATAWSETVSRSQPHEQMSSQRGFTCSSRIMALRRHHNHQLQTHAPPGSTHAPARRPSPPMPGGSPPAGPTIPSILATPDPPAAGGLPDGGDQGPWRS